MKMSFLPGDLHLNHSDKIEISRIIQCIDTGTIEPLQFVEVHELLFIKFSADGFREILEFQGIVGFNFFCRHFRLKDCERRQHLFAQFV